MFLYEQLSPSDKIIKFIAYLASWKDLRLQCFRLVGAGLATISLGVLVWEFGMIFSGLFNGCGSVILQ